MMHSGGKISQAAFECQVFIGPENGGTRLGDEGWGSGDAVKHGLR